MFKRTVSLDDLSRLKLEREDADRRYNEALSQLDAAIQSQPALPDPLAPTDVGALAPLGRWLTAEEPAEATRGWRARAARFVRRVTEPDRARQHGFNAALVEYLTARLESERGLADAVRAIIEVVQEQLAALLAFESRLVVYAQQITPYVDTKDREVAGLMRRINEDCHERLDQLDERVRGVVGGLAGVSDELQRRWESMVARERRYEAHVASLEQLRTTVGLTQQLAMTVKRELERRWPSGLPATEAPPRSGDADGTLDSYKYVGFEEQFRGSETEIRERVAEYLPYFRDAADVLDLGCGRGEFLDLLTQHLVVARGLDLNHEMVELCRSRGHRVDEGDALEYLRSLQDGELGGLFAAQVVEHLPPDYLIRLLDVAFHKLRSGAPIVLETINPSCWFAFFESYIRDITHVRPLHPDTLRYLLLASGFQQVDIRYRASVPEHAKLQPVVVDPAAAALAELADTVNENAARLNALLFTHMDYAVIGKRL